MSKWKDSNEWSDQVPELDAMDRWFTSKTWKLVCKSAGEGDLDSMELMEQVREHLVNLTFHMEQSSPKNRIDYEIRIFEELINQYLES
jgi:hypothetical protein